MDSSRSSKNNGNGAAELKERRKKTFHSFRRGQSRREISPSQYRETCSNSMALPSLHWSLFVQQNAKIEAEGKDYLPSYSLKGGRKEGRNIEANGNERGRRSPSASFVPPLNDLSPFSAGYPLPSSSSVSSSSQN